MSRRLSVLLALSLVLLAAAGCVSSKSANPLSPSVAGPIPGVNITAPMPVEPKGAKVAVDRQPVTLVVDNAVTNGQRPLSYTFEVATDADFANKVLSRTGIAPGDGRTSMRLPDPLATGGATTGGRVPKTAPTPVPIPPRRTSMSSRRL